MSEFTYSALNKSGVKESGAISAPSLVIAGHLLKEQGLLPVNISEKKSVSSIDIMQLIGTISLSEKLAFVQNLSIMIKAGIAMPRGLQILCKQTKNAKFQKILLDIQKQVESGNPLGESLAKYPKIFSNIFVSMIKVGEMTGNLEKSLQYLGIQLQRESDLKSKVKGAMIYPSVIVSAMLIIGVLMSIFVLPKLTAIFKDYGASLPPLTVAVIKFSDFMSNNSVLAIAILIALVVGIMSFLRTLTGKKTLDYILLHFILINPIVKKINLARFSRILSSLMKSGVPIVQGLEVAGESTDNYWYRLLILKASEDVRIGKNLTEALGKDQNLFPFLVVQMIQVGEESGSVEEILSELAEHYEAEVDVTLANLSSIIEPLLLLTIGVVVGILAVALISPIYNLSQSIQ